MFINRKGELFSFLLRRQLATLAYVYLREGRKKKKSFWNNSSSNPYSISVWLPGAGPQHELVIVFPKGMAPFLREVVTPAPLTAQKVVAKGLSSRLLQGNAGNVPLETALNLSR